MITAILTNNDNVYEFRGLSTDKKPIPKTMNTDMQESQYEFVDMRIANGSTFFEMDKGELYMLKVEPQQVIPGSKAYKANWIILE